MISYDMQCQCGHVFESWFKDSGECDRLIKTGLLECPNCGGNQITKALMTPGIPKKGATQEVAHEQALRDWFQENYENVGENFAEEAKAMHYGEADERGIYGTVTPEESEELRDEGVDFVEIHTKKVN